MTFLSLMAALALLDAEPAPVAATEPPLRVVNAWVREAPPGADVLAAYAVFCNHSDAMVTLAGAGSPDFDAVEMHTSVETGDSVTMKRLDSVAIAPHDCTPFEPGGRHFMLLEPRRGFRAGDEVEFTLRLADGREMDIVLPVRRAGETPDGHDKHHHGHH